MLKCIKEFIGLLLVFNLGCYNARSLTVCNCNSNFGTALNLNGFYYSKSFSSERREPLYNVHFLYSNGFILSVGYTQEFDSLIPAGGEQGKMYEKNNWGCFSIKGSELTIQDYCESEKGHKGKCEAIGRIIDRETFVLIRNKADKAEFVFSDTFRLQTSAKPDSLNWLMKKKCK